MKELIEDNKSAEEIVKKITERKEISSIGFYNEREIEEFKDMLDEYPPYEDVEVLSVKKKHGPDGEPWWDVEVDITSIYPDDYRSFVNTTEGNWDVFFA